MVEIEYRDETCPMRMIANAIRANGPHCLGEYCAWWNEDKECCAILAIARRLGEQEVD